MNTPKNNTNNKKTTRLSSRKKQLFSAHESIIPDKEKGKENFPKTIGNELDGINPFDTNTSMNNTLQLMLNSIPSKNKKVISFLNNQITSNSDDSSTGLSSSNYNAVSTKIISSPNCNTPTRISSRVRKESTSKKTVDSPNGIYFNILKTPDQCSPQTPKLRNRTNPDDLNQLFSVSLSIRNKKEILNTQNGLNEIIVEETPVKVVEKRRIDDSENNESMQHGKKIFKIDDIQISTKAFYSTKPEKNIAKIVLPPQNLRSPIITNSIHDRKTSPKVNRENIHYTQQKPHLFKNKRNKNYVLKQYQNKWNKVSIDDFLKTIKSKKLKSLPSKRLLPQQIDEVSKIIQSNKNPIEMARPLNLMPDENDVDFSDLETTDDENISYSVNDVNKEKIKKKKLEEPHVESKNIANKFFKSGVKWSTKQVQITKTLKATLTDGKLTLNKTQKHRSRHHKSKTDDLFAKEQKQIKNIIDSLDAENCETTFHKTPIIEEKQKQYNNNGIIKMLNKNQKSHVEFYSKIPYRTNEPNKIEQQKILLDFLVTHNICNEKNFEIFITNPEAHQVEAEIIIDNLEKELLGINDYFEYRNRLPYNTHDPEKIEQQELLLDFLIQNDICTEQNFNIFIADPDNHKEEAEIIVNNLFVILTNDTNAIATVQKETVHSAEDVVMDSAQEVFEKNSQNTLEASGYNDSISEENKIYFPIFYQGKCKPLQKPSTRSKTFKSLTNGALGLNQYQIDAGQKEFGAKQCNKCGLIYSVHEPEEEKIHTEYHQSLHVLKFRGWIDEDIMLKNELWGSDGRVLRITSFSHIKKRQRLMEVLKEVVDKELGFSSYILPKEYVAFLAVRRQRIVGVCLVQFLDSANRYVCENNVDCCTEEVFEAKCGISRIWVAPFLRKIGIASTLLTCVQKNTIEGEYIDIDLIAFSSPTEDGKAFAKRISKRDDFLVFQ